LIVIIRPHDIRRALIGGDLGLAWMEAKEFHHPNEETRPVHSIDPQQAAGSHT
jgi:hypothetical protein